MEVTAMIQNTQQPILLPTL